jgi:hypothetical protein
MHEAGHEILFGMDFHRRSPESGVRMPKVSVRRKGLACENAAKAQFAPYCACEKTGIYVRIR